MEIRGAMSNWRELITEEDGDMMRQKKRMAKEVERMNCLHHQGVGFQDDCKWCVQAEAHHKRLRVSQAKNESDYRMQRK